MKYLLIALTASLLIACGTKANSDDTRAEIIPSPISGVKCFAIYSESKVVGGNCVKD